MNEVEIVVKSVDKTNFKSAKDAPKDIGRGMSNLKATLLGLGIGSLLVGEFKGATQAAEDANRVGRETDARLKSTGASAWTTAAAIAGLAAREAEKVGVDDDLIQGGENMLLTFQGVRNEVGAGNDIFNRATKTALDLAAGLHQGKIDAAGLQGANIMLGKALEDPVKGMTALTRAGVTFTADQKAQIKNLVEHNDKLGAQKVILKAVGDQFGGTAEASATASGKMAAKIGNLQEKIGNLLLPVVDRAATLLGKLADFIGRNSSVLVPLIGVVATVIGLWKAWAVAQGLLNAVMAANPIGLVIIAIAALVAGIVLAYNKSETFRKIVQAAFRGVQTAAGDLVGTAIRGFRFLLSIWLETAGGILHGAAVAFGWVPGIGGKLKTADKAFQNFKSSVLGKLNDIANAAYGWGYSTGSSYAAGLSASETKAISAAAKIGYDVSGALRTRSPAKYGPLSEGGGPEGWGRHFAELYGRGLGGGGAVRGASTGLAGGVRAGAGGGVLEIRSGGSRLDDLLVELLRNAVRVRGGNVQLALGAG